MKKKCRENVRARRARSNAAPGTLEDRRPRAPARAARHPGADRAARRRALNPRPPRGVMPARRLNPRALDHTRGEHSTVPQVESGEGAPAERGPRRSAFDSTPRAPQRRLTRLAGVVARADAGLPAGAGPLA